MVQIAELLYEDGRKKLKKNKYTVQMTKHYTLPNVQNKQIV